jgi:hypothetical protein
MRTAVQERKKEMGRKERCTKRSERRSEDAREHESTEQRRGWVGNARETQEVCVRERE